MGDDWLSGLRDHPRVAALSRYRVLDTARERGFDDLAALASEICETPIAVVNLISADRQWFKAEVGLGVDSTPLETSFCATAILAEDFMQIPDARLDPRFACNPLVATDPGLRFYAGAVLKSPGGVAFGTLCVLDHQPRSLSERQERALRTLARQVVAQLELRLALIEREEVNARLRASEAAEALAQRIADRERIARELHDTLLQSVQALTWRFQLAADRLAPGDPARPALEAAIDQAEQVIAEGRSRVLDIRSLEERRDVQTILADLVKRHAFDPAVTISISTVGCPRPVVPMVGDEVCRIASEAIFNIWRHAGATRVAIEVAYEPNLVLRFCDDGVGINPDVAVGGADGHFGLLGMRERAAKLSGELVVRRRAEGGSEVALTVPGEIAFATPGERASQSAEREG